MGSERKRFRKPRGCDCTIKKLSLPNGEMVDAFVQAIQEAMETCDEYLKAPYGDILTGVKRMEFEERDSMFLLPGHRDLAKIAISKAIESETDDRKKWLLERMEDQLTIFIFYVRKKSCKLVKSLLHKRKLRKNSFCVFLLQYTLKYYPTNAICVVCFSTSGYFAKNEWTLNRQNKLQSIE